MLQLLPRVIRAGALAVAITLVLSSIVTIPASAQGPTPPRTGDDPILLPGARMPTFDEETEEILQQRDIAFITRRTAGDNPLSDHDAAKARAAAAKLGCQMRMPGKSFREAQYFFPFTANGAKATPSSAK